MFEPIIKSMWIGWRNSERRWEQPGVLIGTNPAPPSARELHRYAIAGSMFSRFFPSANLPWSQWSRRQKAAPSSNYFVSLSRWSAIMACAHRIAVARTGSRLTGGEMRPVNLCQTRNHRRSFPGFCLLNARKPRGPIPPLRATAAPMSLTMPNENTISQGEDCSLKLGIHLLFNGLRRAALLAGPILPLSSFPRHAGRLKCPTFSGFLSATSRFPG